MPYLVQGKSIAAPVFLASRDIIAKTTHSGLSKKTSALRFARFMSRTYSLARFRMIFPPDHSELSALKRHKMELRASRAQRQTASNSAKSSGLSLFNASRSIAGPQDSRDSSGLNILNIRPSRARRQGLSVLATGLRSVNINGNGGYR